MTLKEKIENILEENARTIDKIAKSVVATFILMLMGAIVLVSILAFGWLFIWMPFLIFGWWVPTISLAIVITTVAVLFKTGWYEKIL